MQLLIHISSFSNSARQGSAVTYLREGGSFNLSFLCNYFLNLTVKNCGLMNRRCTFPEVIIKIKVVRHGVLLKFLCVQVVNIRQASTPWRLTARRAPPVCRNTALCVHDGESLAAGFHCAAPSLPNSTTQHRHSTWHLYSYAMYLYLYTMYLYL